MRIYLDCIPCFIKQSLDAARQVTQDESVHEQVVRSVLELTQRLDIRQSPPAIGRQIHQLIRKLTGIEDPYHNAKHQFNETALKLYPKMRQIITQSKDPLETAIRVAIAGNIIDLGVKSHLPKSELDETIDQCLSAELSGVQMKAFRNAVNEAREILYITDNAGEIVFDRLLIEQLPVEKITVAVRGKPTINDATMEDAAVAGLTDRVEVIDNGSDAPGTILNICSPSFQKRFEQADMIIAKGQGNYETLSDVDKNIFFLLKAKCPVIARHLGCDIGQMIFQKSTGLTGENKTNVEGHWV